MSPTHLTTDRRTQRDLFVADLFDASPKGDGPSLEHPLFALRAGDREVRTYERNGLVVTVMPGPAGCATQHDKDVWIYCVSQLVEAINRGREDVSPIVRFTAHDFLTATNRGTSGRSYERLSAALRRLKGTTVETNIATGGKRSRGGFGLVDSWTVVERDGDDRTVAIEVELPGWLFRRSRRYRCSRFTRTTSGFAGRSTDACTSSRASTAATSVAGAYPSPCCTRSPAAGRRSRSSGRQCASWSNPTSCPATGWRSTWGATP